MELIIIFTFYLGFVFYAHISKKLFLICSNIFDILSSLIFFKTLFLEASDQLSFKLAAPGICGGASLVAQMVKSLPAVQETRVQSLGWEDLLEKEVTAHFSVLAWRIQWTEETGHPEDPRHGGY